jgi:flagellar FliJ protein
MNRIETLQTLLEREEKLRDEALAALRQAQAQAEASKAQAESLVTYRAEYRARWAEQFAQGGAIEIVRCYHGFVERLDGAIGQAQNAVAAFDVRLDRARERVMALEMRVATVKRLMERHAKAEQQVQDKREQKNMDELAQRRRPGAAAFAL